MQHRPLTIRLDGYLIAQFLSEKSNRRVDDYGGSVLKRARFIVEIIDAVRRVVPRSVCVGVKLNSVDHQQSSSLAEAMEQISAIIEAGIDFLEISGGTYEDPQMLRPTAKIVQGSTGSSAREAYFLEFAHAVREQFPNVKLILTGGFRSRAGMEAAVMDGACDLIGLGRPAVVNQRLPNDTILNGKVSQAEARIMLEPVQLHWLKQWTSIRMLGAGAETVRWQDFLMLNMLNMCCRAIILGN